MMRGSWRTTLRASASSCARRAAISVKPILLLLLAPPGNANRPVLFQHIPGTGGSSLMTALRRYGCARGLSLCPVVGGVRKHGPEDPRWASVAAYDVGRAAGFTLTVAPNTQRGIQTEPYDAAVEADLGSHIKDRDIKRLYAPRPTDVLLQTSHDFRMQDIGV